MQRVLYRSTWLMAIMVLISCVTVNIYFPAAAAAKAAESIIQDVWHEEHNHTQTPPLSSTVAPIQLHTTFNPRQVMLALLDSLSATAYAQNVDFNYSTPEIERIKNRMANRFGQLKPLLNSGAIGLTNNAFLAIRDASAAPLAQRGQISVLVDAENADRKALYQAIANANHQPQWYNEIQNEFAKKWIAQAQNGWWYQFGGRWIQK